MAHLALYSFSVGQTHEQQQALVRGEQEPEATALEAPPAEGTPAKPRRRARTDRGAFQADDPATPDIDEAYEPEREN
jgi:hypothetical protein